MSRTSYSNVPFGYPLILLLHSCTTLTSQMGCRIASWDSRTLERVAKGGLFHRAPYKDIWRVSKPWNHDTFSCKSMQTYKSVKISVMAPFGLSVFFCVVCLICFLDFPCGFTQLTGAVWKPRGHADPVMPFRHLRRSSSGDGNASHLIRRCELWSNKLEQNLTNLSCTTEKQAHVLAAKRLPVEANMGQFDEKT